MTASPNKADRPAFVERQFAFAAHIRDPKRVPKPADVEDRRMGIYRELFYNNVQDFMASSFPVLREIYGDEEWHALIRDYFTRHRAHTPLFPQMPQEFLQYLESERREHSEDPPFLWELAHYEWIELALAIDTREIDQAVADPNGDLLADVPVLSPLAWPFAYRYPVHRISPEFRPREAPEQPTYLLVYRDRDDQVGFVEMNPVTARLIELLCAQEPPTGGDALAQIAGALAHPNPEVVVQGGLQILQDLQARDVVLGTRRA
jgi:hypothetical protein